MTAWLVAIAAGVITAGIQYSRQASLSSAQRILPGVARALSLTIVVALLLNAPMGPAQLLRPAVYVDGSSSMTRGGADGLLWRAAWDSARAIDAESTWVFGDSILAAGPDGSEQAPTAPATRVRPVVDRARVSGRPAIIITDGEVDDSSALSALPSGSRVIALPRPELRDVAIVGIDAPRAAVDGDSIAVRLTLRAGAGGSAAGSLSIRLDDRVLGRRQTDAMSPYSERQLELAVRLAGAQGSRVLRVIAQAPGDAEPRNDTLSAVVEISRAASAVFVSTSPDQDARFALAVLRGAVALPTRAFLRVAPGEWRQDGTLSPVSEREVRDAIRDAPVAIIHGDSAIFGPPASAILGPYALIVPPDANEGEWYVRGAPPSPLSASLAAIPFDSLPPVAAGPPARGEWIALEARDRGDRASRAIVVGGETPRRTVVVTAAGLWRWRFRSESGSGRGALSRDAYGSLWGSIFDWLAAERTDRRDAVPDESSVRAGEPIRWRRGSVDADTIVPVVLTRRGGSTADTIRLRFSASARVQESPPLLPGVYEVTTTGGRSVLAVNHSAELLPGRPTVRSESTGGYAPLDAGRRARAFGGLYVMAVVLLCAEWVLRRRAGLR